MNDSMKTAVTTVAGLTLAATMTENAEAQTARKSGHITLVVSEGEITLQTLQTAVLGLLRTLKPGGCTGCGLVGFDINILRGDPAFSPQQIGGAGIVGAIETAR